VAWDFNSIGGDGWLARKVVGVQTAQFDFPGDFPGYPTVDPTMVLEIRGIRVVLVTGLVTASRRIRVRLRDSSANRIAETAQFTATPANSTDIIQFGPGLVSAQSGGILREPFFPMYMPQFGTGNPGSSLSFEITGVQTADYIDEICLMGLARRT